jgi:WS/DGAT/MGAT family acyltransferase
MSLLDAAMFGIETAETPMHLGGACIFRMPKDAGPDYVRRLYDTWRGIEVTRSPLNYRLTRAATTDIRPAWEVLEHVDLGQHLFHLALPEPGGRRELSELTGRLHSTLLDRSRPLWEIYLIEGLAGRRFATYTKIHHALMDGTNAMRIFMSPLSEDPEARDNLPAWGAPASAAGRQSRRIDAGMNGITGIVRKLGAVYGSARGIYQGISKLPSVAVDLEQLFQTDRPSPDSVLNGPVTERRLTDSVMLDLARIRAVGKAAGATVNDVALAVCGGALRRYLQEIGQLPRDSLRALVPVSLRKDGDERGGNTATAMTAPLGTNIANASKRLAIIGAATRAGKERLQTTTTDAAKTLRALLLLAPLAAEQLSGVRLLGRSPFNLVISNVPGPLQRLYLYGAELERTVPDFLVGPGMALSILLTSYHDRLCINVTTCPDRLPNVQRIFPLLEECFAELEGAIRTPARATGARKAPAARRKGRHPRRAPSRR